MKIKELSNEEVVFVHALLRDMLDEYNLFMKNNGVSYSAYSPFGKIGLFKEFNDEEYNRLAGSLKLRLLNSSTSKLQPIVELITDSYPKITEKIEDALYKKDTDEDQ